jgi:nucleoside-diphosphate-sugar epimerase
VVTALWLYQNYHSIHHLFPRVPFYKYRVLFDEVEDLMVAQGARRFLHMGTEAVLWKGQDLVDVSEDYPYPQSTPYLYSETKAEAERLVVAANQNSGMATVVLRPRFVWGPGDQTLAPEIRAMLWIARGCPSQAWSSTRQFCKIYFGYPVILRIALYKGLSLSYIFV